MTGRKRNASGQGESSLKARKEIGEAFDRFRSYVEDENRLINERISRTLVVSGFLFLGFAWIVRIKFELASDVDTCDSHELIPNLADTTIASFVGLVLTFAGLLVSGAAMRGVGAAHRAISKLEATWDEYLQQFNLPYPLGVPYLTGGGCAEAKRGGRQADKWLLIALMALWAILTISFILILYWEAPTCGGTP